jgi:predicted component of type VI protein secretion system
VLGIKISVKIRENKMKITKRQLRRLIREELEDILDQENPEDVEAVEGVWAGGDDLVDPIDHLEAGGSVAYAAHEDQIPLIDDIMGTIQDD